MTAEPLDPIISEFASQADAEAYERWFRAKVAASLADARPCIPHDQAMAKIDATLAIASRKSEV
jgi:hypothetical protein